MINKEIKTTCYKGTRILVGNEKRSLINRMISVLLNEGFNEISMPVIQFQDIFSGKVGEENNNLMFNFTDRANRYICLAPEYTAVIQKLAKEDFKNERNVKLFYVQQCFRGEKPQDGRYREFTQLGVEILNPYKYQAFYTTEKYLIDIAKKIICDQTEYFSDKFTLNTEVKRGLDYYVEGKGFEISCDRLGAQKQVCGGGEYDGGYGFAIGIDRLMLVK